MLLKLDEFLFSRLFIGEAVSSTFSLDPNGFKRYYCFTDADHEKLVKYPVIELKTNMCVRLTRSAYIQSSIVRLSFQRGVCLHRQLLYKVFWSSWTCSRHSTYEFQHVFVKCPGLNFNCIWHLEKIIKNI